MKIFLILSTSHLKFSDFRYFLFKQRVGEEGSTKSRQIEGRSTEDEKKAKRLQQFYGKLLSKLCVSNRFKGRIELHEAPLKLRSTVRDVCSANEINRATSCHLQGIQRNVNWKSKNPPCQQKHSTSIWSSHFREVKFSYQIANRPNACSIRFSYSCIYIYKC